MIAALRARGVRYASNQTRWHDPFKRTDGKGARIKGRFIGLKLKRSAYPESLSPAGTP